MSRVASFQRVRFFLAVLFALCTTLLSLGIPSKAYATTVTSPFTDMAQYRSDGIKPIVTGGTNNSGTVILPVGVDTDDSTGPKIQSRNEGGGEGGVSFDISMTPAGTDRLMVVNISYLNGATVDSVTFDGQSFTQGSCTADAGESFKNEMWYLVAPNATTANVTVTFSASMSETAIQAVNFVNANQTTPISAQACNTNVYGVWTKHASVSLSAQTDELIYAGINSYSDGQVFTPNANATAIWLGGTTNERAQTAFRSGTGGSTTLDMQGTSAWPWVMSALAIAPQTPYTPVDMKLQYEVLTTADPFTDTATHTKDISFAGIPQRFYATDITGLANGDYHWQARVCDPTLVTCTAWNAYGANLETDPDFTIISNTTPNDPSSLGPTQFVDGSSGTNNQPALTFSQSDPDTADNLKYQIEIDNTSDFSSPVVQYTSTLLEQGSSTFTVGQAAGGGTYGAGSASQVLYNGSYYWRVKTIDENTASSSFTTANSGAVAFIITDSPDPATPPDDPTSLGPTAYVDGSSGTNPQPTLEFTLSDPNVADTVQYRIQISRESGFVSPVIDYTSELAAQGAASFTVGQAAGGGAYLVGSEGQSIYNGSYYWRVQAIDNGAHTSSYTTANSGSVAFIITDNVDPITPITPTILAQYKSNDLRNLLVGAETTDTTEKLKVSLSRSSTTGPHRTSFVHNGVERDTSITTDAITPSGSNRVLIAAIDYGSLVGASVEPDSVTFHGQSFTKACETAGTGSAIWYLVNPDLASDTVTVTFPITADGIAVAIVAYENVDQVTPIRDSSCAVSSGYDRYPQTTLSTQVGDTAVAVLGTYTGSINRLSAYQPFYEIIDDGGTINTRFNLAEKTAIGVSTEVKWWGERRWPWSVAAVALVPASTVTPVDFVARIEIQPVGSDFTGIPNATGSAVSYVGTAVDVLVTTPTLSVDTNYHWQAQACSSDFVYCSDWAPFGENDELSTDFRVVTNTAPYSPDNLGDERLIDGNFTNNLSPTFSFSLTDPEANEQLGYRIILSEHADFSSPLLDYTSDYRDQMTTVGILQLTYFTLGQDNENGTYAIGAEGQDPLLPDTTYYWRVKTIDSHGLESSYTDESFTTDTTAPVVSNFQITVGDTTATLTWDTSKLSSSFSLLGPRTDGGFYTTQADTSPRVLNHSYTITSLLPCVSYFVQAVSGDSAGNLGFSGTEYFTTTGCTGNAAVSDLITDTIYATSGGTLSLLDAGTGPTLDIPVAAYATTSADLQIKKLDKTAVFNVTSNPSGHLPVGDFVYDFHAVQSVFTAITTFNAPITVTLAYDDVDQSAVTAGTLKMYRWNGTSWNVLSNCTDDSGAKTLTCTTTGFSTFSLFGADPSVPVATPTPTPGPTASPTPGDDLVIECGAVTPRAPSIFQLDSRATAVTLYITPSSTATNRYTISYGRTTGADTSTLSFSLDGRAGVIVRDVTGLLSNTQYYFKVRAENGCSVSEWSATRGRLNTAEIGPGGEIIPLPGDDGEPGASASPNPSATPGAIGQSDETPRGPLPPLPSLIEDILRTLMTPQHLAEAVTVLGALAALQTTAVAPFVGAASSGKLSLNLLEQLLRAIGILPPVKIQGITYDTHSFKMIPFVLLTFEGKATGSDEVIHETAVTDQYGRYGGMKLLPGQYTATAAHQEYAFPTLKVRPFYFPIQDFYRGEVFTQQQNDKKRFLTVPLDPLSSTERRSLRRQLMFFFALVTKISNALTVPLFVLSIFLAVQSPTLLNIVFAAVYGMLCASRIPALLRKPTLQGITTTATGAPVAHAIIKLLDTKTNEVVDVTMSDEDGKYRLFAKPGIYTYQVVKDGFQATDTDMLSLSQLDTTTLHEKNFTLEPYAYAR